MAHGENGIDAGEMRSWGRSRRRVGRGGGKEEKEEKEEQFPTLSPSFVLYTCLSVSQ